jgi:DNA-binding HxlR family transcriptional regulator
MTNAGEAPRRSYEEGCLVSHALDVIGDRWALLVVRELMLGPKRFAALRAGLPGLSANILTRRLTELEAAGVLERKALPPPASVQVYELTRAGLALWPVLRTFCRWGAAMPGHDPRLFISPTALMLSMRAMVVPDDGPEVTAGFSMAGETFLARMGRGRYRVARVDQPAGDLRFEGTGNTMAMAIYGPLPLAETVAAGAIGFTGDLGLGQAFVDCFSLNRDEIG